MSISISWANTGVLVSRNMDAASGCLRCFLQALPSYGPRKFIWRYSIALTKRRCLIRFLERRNRVSPRNRVSGDTFNFETSILLAKMRTMTPEEAAAVADQAVAEAMREAEAAEADALAATTFAAEAFKKRKANTRRMKPSSAESGTTVHQLEDPPV